MYVDALVLARAGDRLKDVDWKQSAREIRP